MSGGQQQMLAVSRALIGDATLILADELSVGLAPVVVDEIFAALETLREAGRSILIVEQYVDRALTVADYVYILHKGRVVFVGEPDQCRDLRVFDRYLGFTLSTSFLPGRLLARRQGSRSNTISGGPREGWVKSESELGQLCAVAGIQ